MPQTGHMFTYLCTLRREWAAFYLVFTSFILEVRIFSGAPSALKHPAAPRIFLDLLRLLLRHQANLFTHLCTFFTFTWAPPSHPRGRACCPRCRGGVPLPLAKSSFKNLLVAMRLRGGGVVCEEPGF
jgi:hypothetical protein